MEAEQWCHKRDTTTFIFSRGFVKDCRGYPVGDIRPCRLFAFDDL